MSYVIDACMLPEKKRKYYAFQRQCNEKLSNVLGCPLHAIKGLMSSCMSAMIDAGLSPDRLESSHAGMCCLCDDATHANKSGTQH